MAKKNTLAAQLDKIVEEHTDHEKIRRQAEDQAAARATRAEAQQAARIVADIPAAAKESLAKNRRHIRLYEDSSVGISIDVLTGVAGKLRDLLTAEGLRDRLWVDIDCSGNHQSRNSLMLWIVSPTKSKG